MIFKFSSNSTNCQRLQCLKAHIQFDIKTRTIYIVSKSHKNKCIVLDKTIWTLLLCQIKTPIDFDNCLFWGWFRLSFLSSKPRCSVKWYNAEWYHHKMMLSIISDLTKAKRGQMILGELILWEKVGSAVK